MRRYLGLAAALLLLVVLVLFAVREVNKDEREGKKPVNEIVFPYGSAQVLEIELKNPDGSARFRRGTGGWEAAEAPADADLSSVPDLIGAWSRVRLVEVVDEAPRTEDLGRFGLDQPRVVLRARLAPAAQDASGREPRLEVGKDSPVRPAVYARLDGHPRVVLVTPDVLDLEQGIGRQVLGLPSLVKDREREAGAEVERRPARPAR